MFLDIEVSVIITSYNNLYTLRFAFEAFHYQTCSSFEVIVGDNGSNDGTVDWLKERQSSTDFGLQVVEKEQEGFGIASVNNACAKQAKGKRLLFTNADVIHSPQSIEAHSRVKKNCIGCGIVSGIDTKGVPLVDRGAVRNYAKLICLCRDYPTKRTNAVFCTRKSRLI